MTGPKNRFPESDADPLGVMARREPVFINGHSGKAKSLLRDVQSDSRGMHTPSDLVDDWVFRSCRTASLNPATTPEYSKRVETTYEVRVEQNETMPLSQKQEKKARREGILYVYALFAAALLITFFVAVYTPFIRVAWIESLEEHGQSAQYAKAKCALLDFEDAYFRGHALRPMLVRAGCTMVEPGQSVDGTSQSNRVRPNGKPGRGMPDPDAATSQEFRLWSFL